MELREALAAAGGAARWGRLRELGVSERALRAGLASGEVRRAGRGGYAALDAPDSLVAAVRLGGVVSHAAAAVLHGLELWCPPTVLDVTIPLGSRRAEEGVRVHRADLDAAERDPSRAVTSPLRTLVDCGRTLRLLEAVVAIESALRGGTVTVPSLRQAGEVARGHGAAALRRAIRHVDVFAASPLESALRLLVDLTDAEVRSQVRIPGVGRVDLLLDGWLVLEADGFEFHADRSAYRTDRLRANMLAERGYVLLRFTWEDVRFRPAWVLAQIERVRARPAAARRPLVALPTHSAATDQRRYG